MRFNSGFYTLMILSAFLLLNCKNVAAPEYPSFIDYQSIPAFAADSSVNMIVEIPAGSTAKYEINKSTYKLELDSIAGAPRFIEYLGYPGNYGMIPNTLMSRENGGDGDPVDILMLGPSQKLGSVVMVRPIGVLKLLDNGEKDDKIIAIPIETHWSEVRDVSQLDSLYPGVKEIISTFFQNYKGPNEMELKKWNGRSKALDIIKSSVQQPKQ